MEHAALVGTSVTLSPSSRRQLIAALSGGAIGALAAALTLGPLQMGSIQIGSAQMISALIIASAVLGATMAAIAVEDALRFRVPDPWVYGAMVSGVIWNAGLRIKSDEGLLVAVGAALFSAILCGGVFLAVREIFFRLRGADGLGLGDVKLAAAGGAWLGWELFPFVVLVAAVGALAFVGTRVLRGRAWPASKRLAFGAFLAPAVWATWLVFESTGGG